MHGDYLLPNMAKPTPQQRWNDFVQGCSNLDFKIVTREDLGNIVSTTLQLEYRLAGEDVPPNPTEIERRTDRFGEARKYLENHTSQLASKKNSVIGVLGEIMRLEKRYDIGKDYCTTVAASFLEALPYLLGEREFGGADQGIEQVPIYSLDLILRAAQTEISGFNTRFQSCQSFPKDRIASELDNVAVELVQTFGLKRYTGPDQNIPFGLKALEVMGLSGHFYRPTLFEAKLGERQSGYEKRKLNKTITTFLAANLIVFGVGEAYLLSQGYNGEDLGNLIADAVYGELPESNIFGGEAAKAGVPKKGKRLGYVPLPDGGVLLDSGINLTANSVSEEELECPKNLQREYFERFNQALADRSTYVDDAKSSRYISSLQAIVDDFRKRLSSDLIIKDGAAAANLMLGSQENYTSVEDQEGYNRIENVLSVFVGDGHLHLYSEGRAQDPGTLILQPTLDPSSRGGK